MSDKKTSLPAIGTQILTIKKLPLPTEVYADFRLYQAAYKEDHGEDITSENLVAAMVEQFLKTDKNFRKYKKGSGSA